MKFFILIKFDVSFHRDAPAKWSDVIMATFDGGFFGLSLYTTTKKRTIIVLITVLQMIMFCVPSIAFGSPLGRSVGK